MNTSSYADWLTLLMDKTQDTDIRHAVCHEIARVAFSDYPFWRLKKRRFRHQAARAFLHMITDAEDSESLRYWVASLFSSAVDKQTIQSLIRLMLSHPDAKVRELAAYALIWVNYPTSYKALLRVVNNPHEKDEVRGCAVEALVQSKNKRAVPHLIRLLQNDSVRLRWEVIFALELLEDKRAVPALQHIAATDNRPSLDPDVKTLGEQAQEAINQINSSKHHTKKRPFMWPVLVLTAIYLYWRHGRFCRTRF